MTNPHSSIHKKSACINASSKKVFLQGFRLNCYYSMLALYKWLPPSSSVICEPVINTCSVFLFVCHVSDMFSLEFLPQRAHKMMRNDTEIITKSREHCSPSVYVYACDLMYNLGVCVRTYRSICRSFLFPTSIIGTLQ